MMKRHAAALRLPPRPSASVAPELTAQEESFLKIADELPPLFVRCGREFPRVEGVVSDPNWPMMFRMAAAGGLRVVTARDASSLVGFAFNIVGPHLMYKNVCYGITNAIFLDKPYRFGWFPVKFLRHNLDCLREWGVKETFIARDVANLRLGKVFERLGYKAVEVGYTRSL
jgi:GNAT superfamily N-acetyltransferase